MVQKRIDGYILGLDHWGSCFLPFFFFTSKPPPRLFKWYTDWVFLFLFSPLLSSLFSYDLILLWLPRRTLPPYTPFTLRLTTIPPPEVLDIHLLFLLPTTTTTDII